MKMKFGQELQYRHIVFSDFVGTRKAEEKPTDNRNISVRRNRFGDGHDYGKVGRE